MQLIVGTKCITPSAIHRITGGVEATLRGDALLSVLDATFNGAGSIEVMGGDLDRQPMDVASIEMSGADTRVKLVCCGPQRQLM